MKKILILEDNPTTLNNLSHIVKTISIKNIVYPFEQINNAYECAMDHNIDLFIVDIILDRSTPGDSSGLKFAENIRKIKHYLFTPIIFVTCLEDVKLYTYENLHCYSFIEKPFNHNRVQKIIEESLAFRDSVDLSKTLYFRKDGIILAVEREEIIYTESINHMMYIHVKQGDVLELPYLTLKKLLDDLDSPSFIQCSRSIIVNRNFIENIDIPNQTIHLKQFYGSIGIGLRYKKKLKNLFMKHL